MRQLFRVSAYSFIVVRFVRHKQLVAFLCALCALCGGTSAQDFKQVHDGVEYAQVDHKIGTDPVKINVLRLDLTKVRLDVHHAMDAAIGTEKTSSIATRHGAVAAINSGFFRLDTSIFAGEAANWLQIDGETYSDAPVERIALFIINNPKNLGLDKTGAHIKKLFGTQSVRIGKVELKLSGINRQLLDDELVLFTPVFNRTTLTGSSGVEVIVDRGRVISVNNGSGSSIIPESGYVLSATGSKAKELLAAASLRSRFGFFHSYLVDMSSNSRGRDPIYDTSTLSSLAEDIVAGVPQLIKNGKIDITWEQEKSSKAFVETRHPRTAVAKMKDGKFLMITVDGRQPGVSVGMNLNELADYMLSLGAVDAMNLDGGGSTTMFLDGKVVNKPSDKEGERKVGDAILVTLRKMQKPAR